VNAKYADGSPVATALTFTVTFRCDQTVVDFANRTFPFALTGQGRQASYVPLHARENAGAGTVVRLPFAFTPNAGAGGEKKGSAKAATHDSDMAQARFVAKWMAERGPSLLGARRWSEVAILLPRKEWFLTFKAALAEQNIGTQIASPFGIMGHSATYGWVTAVATAISEPRNHFEIYGVLREIFGFSDEAIANYVTRGNKAECNELRLDAGIVGDSPVAAVLRDLAEIRQKVLHLPVREGLDLLISQTGLHGRLMSLPEEQRLDLEGMLDYLTELASSVDVNDGNFALFANAAKQRFFASAQPTPSAPEKVVLITNQKAKGLQWDCVIVPYIAKAISSPPPRYPSLLPRYAGGGVAFSSNDIKPESDTAIRAENLNEIQRIGYVTVTRAKHTLVLVDDATGAEKLSPLSLAHALTVADDKKAQAAFLDLPGDVSPEQAMEPELLSTPLAVEGSDEGLSAEVVAKGVEAAGNFCVRILPHTKKRRRAQSHFPAEGLIVEDPEQAKTGERDFNAPAKNGSNGVDYGIWFHSLMQFFPWSGSDAQREAHVQERLKLCPLLSRGTEEAARLLASPLAAELRGVQWTLHPEFRVFAVLEGNKCIDGSLDLLAKEVKEGSLIWYIYDYKTDVRSSLEKLAIEYGPQMTNYADALRTILGPKADIRGRLYSTVKGLCIDVHL
jgi:ATP-dependent exoDNAse (exonuclease V) beta subunit